MSHFLTKFNHVLPVTNCHTWLTLLPSKMSQATAVAYAFY